MAQTDKIGDRLRRTREMVRLSARSLAAISGLSSGSIWWIETKGQIPKYETMMRLCEVLGIEVHWLIAGGGRAPQREEVLAAVQRAKKTRKAA